MLWTFSILDYVISLWLLRVDSSEAEGQRLVFPGSVVRLRRFVHILLVDNELAQPKTNGATMERAARNKEGGEFDDGREGGWKGVVGAINRFPIAIRL